MDPFSPLSFTAALLFRVFLAQPFTIPSSAMMPTLDVGDYVVAAKFSYGYSNFSLPAGELMPAFSYGRTIAKRGDVVVFRLPGDPSVDYVMRVIGLPGDKVQVKDGVSYINGEALTLTPAGTYTSKNSDALDSYVDVPVFIESLPGKRSHTVLDTGPSVGDNTAVFEVPADHYFMMGDNRDNSNDSRFNVGYVPVGNVHAKVLVAITWPDGRLMMRDVK